MARILAVDFGEKRIGLATSDASGSLVTPRRTVSRRDDGDAVEQIRRFCEEEEVELVVFGIPRRPDGAEGPFAARIRSFAAKFSAAAGLPVLFHEETLTSREAASRAGRERAALDPAAAAVLLEDFLAHRAEAGKARR
jgi:putative Holliday junction resolvase